MSEEKNYEFGWFSKSLVTVASVVSLLGVTFAVSYAWNKGANSANKKKEDKPNNKVEAPSVKVALDENLSNLDGVPVYSETA